MGLVLRLKCGLEFVWNRLPRDAVEVPPVEMLKTGHSAGQPPLADPAGGRLDDLQRSLQPQPGWD